MKVVITNKKKSTRLLLAVRLQHGTLLFKGCSEEIINIAGRFACLRYDPTKPRQCTEQALNTLIDYAECKTEFHWQHDWMCSPDGDEEKALVDSLNQPKVKG